jgi:hypothetical protein
MRPLFLTTNARRHRMARLIVVGGYICTLASFAFIGVLFAWRG